MFSQSICNGYSIKVVLQNRYSNVYLDMVKYFLFVLSLIGSIPLLAQNYNMELLGRLEFDVELSDVWGYVDEDDNEYALIGLYDNFAIVDVTDPADPTEVFRTIGGNSSDWRDIKTWGDYAYVTCECGPGLLIVDLRPLPDSTNLTYTYWTHDSVTFYQAHNLFIDDKGIAHIFGAFYSRGGSIMLDLNDDPMNPTVLGVYDENYLHDGVVRGDTLWGSAVNDGKLQVIDVSDPSEPELLSFWSTPNSFTHNAWFSDDSRYIFTTDEVPYGSIAAYDAQNILNPIELDIWRVADTAIIPHNTHYHNGYLVTSHYTYGINILDVSRPHNMVESGRYDTSPDFVYEGFRGCWGAYPYLPSGIVLATDIEEGLYVFDPNYQRACYLEGSVTDIHSGNPIVFPEIEIIELDQKERASLVGEYALGTLDAGSYTVIASKEGYRSDTAYNVQLVNGELTIQNFQLDNWPVGITESETDSQVKVYPNPTVEVINISAPSEITEVILYTIEGLAIETQAPKAAQVSISCKVPSGNYILEVRTEEYTEYKSVVIK